MLVIIRFQMITWLDVMFIPRRTHLTGLSSDLKVLDFQMLILCFTSK